MLIYQIVCHETGFRSEAMSCEGSYPELAKEVATGYYAQASDERRERMAKDYVVVLMHDLNGKPVFSQQPLISIAGLVQQYESTPVATPEVTDDE